MKKILLLSLLAFSFPTFSQQTGDFVLGVTFNEADYNFTRNLYYHVPSNYDPQQSYKLVVGFRGGPHSNAGEFRDQLSFLSDSIGAIILCPENADHFWNQEGLTKQLFNYSVDTTLSLYNIDTNYIYLTGLSYGGRHSVIVSMDTDNGSIPNLRGVIPFAAGSDSQLEPDYTNIADFPPACICIGLNDSQNFITVSNTIHNDIQANSGQSILNEISGVGHTVDFPTYPNEMMECLSYIESTYNTSTLNEADEANSLKLHPNPASEILYLEYDSALELSILDATGRVVKSIEPGSKQVDISDLEPGNYFVSSINGSIQSNKKLIIF